MDGELVATREIIERVRTGTSLSGKRIDLASLFRRLRGEAVPIAGWIVHDAVLGSASWDQTELPADLTFRNCRFASQIVFRGVTINGGLQFEECLFEKPFLLIRSTVNAAVQFKRCVFRRESAMRGAYGASLPSFENCSFEDRLELELSTAPVEGALSFYECTFAFETNVLVSSPIQSIRFDNCRFRANSITILEWGGCEVSLSFIGSDLQGRCILQNSASVTTGMGVDFSGVSIGGSLDLERCSVDWLDFRNAVVTDGRLLIPMAQLRLRDEALVGAARGGAWRDRNSRDLTAFSPRPEDGQLSPDQIYGQLSAQFRQLSAGLAAMPRLDREADECLYLSSEYGWYAMAHRVGPIRYALTAVTLKIAFILMVAGVISASSWLFSGILGLLLAIAVSSPLIMRHKSYGRVGQACLWLSEPVAAVLTRLVLQRMLGFGIYFRPVFTSALCLIAGYASFYWLISAVEPAKGEIVDHRGCNIASGQSPIRSSNPDSDECVVQPALPVQIQNALYFSTVTFTTLGYGDFQARGRCQLVAGSEALVGAIVISLMTVVFARKYLRM